MLPKVCTLIPRFGFIKYSSALQAANRLNKVRIRVNHSFSQGLDIRIEHRVYGQGSDMGFSSDKVDKRLAVVEFSKNRQ